MLPTVLLRSRRLRKGPVAVAWAAADLTSAGRRAAEAPVLAAVLSWGSSLAAVLAACRALPPGLRGAPVGAWRSCAPRPRPWQGLHVLGPLPAASGLELMLSSSFWERVFGPSRRKAPVR